MTTKNLVNKVGDKLKDIKDIFGNVHHEATVVHIGENTITINDDQTNERWIVSNLDIGKKFTASRQLMVMNLTFELARKSGKPMKIKKN